jgi:hypothetical protein
VLEAIPIPVRLVLEVMNAVSAEKHEVAGARVIDLYDALRTDGHHDPVIIKRWQPWTTGTLRQATGHSRTR